MINKFVISGNINEKIEYTAIYCGRDLSRETYFFDQNPKDESTIIRFFSKGNELILKRDGVEHSGNGGSFCEYMFGINIPFADLIRPNILNRLIIYGAYYNESKNSLLFKRSTDGFETYENIFKNGNAVCNWFFFVASKFKMEIIDKQKWILKHTGKFLKTFPHIGLENEKTPFLLADSLVKKLPEDEAQLFLLCITNKTNKTFSELINQLLKDNAINSPEAQRKINSFADVDSFTKERIKIDTIYKHSNNKKLIDTYTLLLVEAQKHKSLTQAAQNYIHRYKTLLKKKSIPQALYEQLEEKLPVKIEPKDVKDYLEEFRLLFLNLLFTEHHFREQISNDDLKILLLGKHKAFLDNNKLFEQILLEIGRKLDEIKDEESKIKQMDFFSKIVTYFDLYDNCAETVTKLAFDEQNSMDSKKIISLTRNMDAFNAIGKGLFKKLFIDPLLENRYLTNYGLKKITMLTLGLEEILKKNKTVSELLDEITFTTKEEAMYKMLTKAVRKIANFKSLTYPTQEEKNKLKAKLMNTLLSEYNLKCTISDQLFKIVIQDYNLEALYFSETIPSMILNDKWDARRDFIRSSGLEVSRIEEVERLYCSKNNLGDNYINFISIPKRVA